MAAFGRNAWMSAGSALLLVGCVLALGAAPAAAEPEERVRIAVKEAPPFVWRDADEEWAGLAIDLWRRIARDVDLPRDRYEQHSLGDLLRSLAAGDADVGIGALSVTAEREKDVDFTHPFLTAGLGIAVSAEEGQEGGMGDLIATLWSHGLGWLLGGLVFGLFLMGVLLAVAERSRNPTFRNVGPKQALSIGMWWAYILALGNKSVHPQSRLGRFLAALVMAASVVLLSVFIGAIASVLTVSHFQDQILEPEDLRRFRVGTPAESTSARFLRRERMPHAEFDTIEEALDRVGKGKLDAVVYDRPLLYHLSRTRFRDEIRVLPLVFETQYYAFALAPESPHREAINRALLGLRDTRWWRELRYQHLGR